VAGGKLQDHYPEEEALHAAKVRKYTDDFYEFIDGSKGQVDLRVRLNDVILLFHFSRVAAKRRRKYQTLPARHRVLCFEET